ncbi:hypothetical protein DFQ13_110232 [Actinokineospora spheciospongiae]|nr:hypothetical protein DFQ13_110232 [Actinokineospora spheciospongiae]
MGFHPPVGGPKTILKASRSIFTDLNKHAVKVSPEREYLLDDRSLLAVCTRSVVTSGIGGGSFEKSKTWPGRIPLAIIDWNQPNRSKFGDGFFVSTIQSLHQLVSEVVNTNQPRPTEYERLEAWLDSITARFELSKSNIWKLDTIKDRLREVQQNDLPFALTTTEVEEAAQGFRESIGQIIVQCLLGMTPYSALFSAYSENGFLGGQKEFWLGQAADGRSAYVTQFGENPKADADRLSQSVKKKYRLAYQVVFQRGFILAAREIDSFRNELADLWQIENSRQKVLEQWIKIFNERIESLLDNSDFWWGTAVLFDGSINYNQVSKKAIVGAIVLATIDFPDMGVSIEKVQLSKRSITNLLSSNRGPILELIESDRFTCDAPTEHQTLMAKRWVTALASLEPGVKAHDPLVKLMKAATRMYRDGIKRHIGQLADANNVTLDDDGVEKLLRSFGARRMAFWATD